MRNFKQRLTLLVFSTGKKCPSYNSLYRIRINTVLLWTRGHLFLTAWTYFVIIIKQICFIYRLLLLLLFVILLLVFLLELIKKIPWKTTNSFRDGGKSSRISLMVHRFGLQRSVRTIVMKYCSVSHNNCFIVSHNLSHCTTTVLIYIYKYVTSNTLCFFFQNDCKKKLRTFIEF